MEIPCINKVILSYLMYLNPWRALRDGREIKDFIHEGASVSPVRVTFVMEATVKLAVVKH